MWICGIWWSINICEISEVCKLILIVIRLWVGDVSHADRRSAVAIVVIRTKAVTKIVILVILSEESATSNNTKVSWTENTRTRINEWSWGNSWLFSKSFNVPVKTSKYRIVKKRSEGIGALAVRCLLTSEASIIILLSWLEKISKRREEILGIAYNIDWMFWLASCLG